MSASRDTFEKIVGRLNYPMLLVTTAVGEERSGCLVGFSTQCSIDPPRFIVCLSEKNHTTRIASAADSLAVHFPPAAALDLAKLFGSETDDEIDKFSRCRWHPGPHGLPIIDECRRWFVGTIRARHKLGDHVAFTLDVSESCDDDGEILMFRDVKHLAPGHDA